MLETTTANAAALAEPKAADNFLTSSKETFPNDYIKSLRKECAGYRIKAKGYESALRSLLGLKEDESLDDLAVRITAYQQALAQQQKLANQRLIAAKMQALEGYDLKRLARVIDLTYVHIDHEGNVIGLEEAAKQAEKEFPAVKSHFYDLYVPLNPIVGAESHSQKGMP